MGSKDKNSTGEGWVVLHCDMDDSHVLVPDSDVICALDHVQVGEAVMFNYPGFKKLLRGTVKAVSDNFDDMKKFQDEVNSKTKPRREPSFHEDQPRRATRSRLSEGFRSLAGSGSQRRKPTPKNSKDSSSSTFKPSKGTVSSSEGSSSAALVANKRQKVSHHDSSRKDDPKTKATPLNMLIIESSSSSGSSSSDSNSSSDEEKVVKKSVQDTDHGNGKKKTVTIDTSSKTTTTETAKDTVDSLSAKKDSLKKGKIVVSEKNKGASTVQPVKKGSAAAAASEGAKTESRRVTKLQTDEPVFKGSGSSNISSSNGQKSKDNSKIVVASDKSDSDSDSGLDDEQVEVLEKLSKKKKYKDLGELLALSKHKKSQKVVNHVQPVEDNLDLGGGSCEDQLGSAGFDLDVTDMPSDVDNDRENLDERTTTKTAKRMYLPKKKAKDPLRILNEIVFDGDFFRYSAGATVKVEKLSADFDVWVASSDLKDIRRRWHTATAVARSLTRKVFSDEALLSCSVSGKAKVTKDGRAEKRTALHPDGLSAILDFVRNRCEKKKWPKPSDSSLKQAINNMLYEERECKIVIDSD